jgi:nardilysin
MTPRGGSADPSHHDALDAVKAIRGPDLNATRGELDKKLYRQILLPNGIRCLLIQDTVAMHMNSVGDYYDIDDEIDEGSISDDGTTESQEEGRGTSGSRGEEESVDSESNDGVRDAAAAVLVGAGSMFDPPSCQGMVSFRKQLFVFPTETQHLLTSLWMDH